MNIEAVWAKLQESRKAERLEQRRQREQAAAAEAASTEDVKEQQDEKEQVDEKGEDTSAQKPLDESVSSLGASVGSLGASAQSEEPSTPGILSKDEKYKLWEEIKMKSK